MENAYLTTKEIAEMTNVKHRTAIAWCRKGKLKASKPSGKSYLVKREDFEAFMAASSNTASD